MDIKGKVEEELSKLTEDKADDILQNFNQFKKYLADKVELGESMGLSDESLAKTTELVANYLAKHEKPRNREENLLLELWNAGSKEEQHTLAHLLLKMVKAA